MFKSTLKEEIMWEVVPKTGLLFVITWLIVALAVHGLSSRVQHLEEEVKALKQQEKQ
jgi:hypothetical protein